MKIGLNLIQNQTQSHYHDVIFLLVHPLLEHFGTEPTSMFKVVRPLSVQITIMMMSGLTSLFFLSLASRAVSRPSA